MKIDRLFAITNILLDKKTVTAVELASHFGVTVRTIYRDLDILSTNGVPIYTTQGKGGGISLLEEYSIDKTLLSMEEQKQVLVALESVKATGQVDVEESMIKLRSIFKQSNTDWIEIEFSDWEQSEKDTCFFEILKTCIINGNVVNFEYYSAIGQKSKRRIEPLRLIFKGHSWYLYGYCKDREDYRFFKLSRMEKLECTEQLVTKKAPGKIAKEYSQSDLLESIQIKLKVAKDMGYRILDELRDSIITEEDNFYIVNANIPNSHWIYNYLLGYGDKIEILEPKSMRATYKQYLETILDKY